MTENRYTRRLDRMIRLGVLEHIEIAENGMGGGGPMLRESIEAAKDKAYKDTHFVTKNVCAKVGTDLSDKIDQTVGWLGTSKRGFIEAALWAAVERFDQIAEDEGLADALENGKQIELIPVATNA